MHTTKYSTSARRAGAFKHKLIATACAALALATAAVPAKAASVLWVSDTTPLGFSGAGGNNLTDAGFVRLLESAGHTVARWNSPDAQATRLSAGDLATVNGYDLVIMGRAGASGQHQFPQSLDWNTGITKPLICMSPYFVRPDGGRLGWFTGGTLPDTTPTALTAGDSNDPAVDFLFGGVTMNGLNTVDKYDELIDRNTSLIQNAPVAGGIAYSTANFAAEGNGAATTAYTIVGFPTGTAVGTGTSATNLAGYRMFFGGGSREGGQFPKQIPLYTGRESLTSTGEKVFLRAIQLALNSGVAPATDPLAPIVFTTQPANVTVGQGGSVTLTAQVTGASARTLQWQRDSGDGITFTNIPDAGTPFLLTRLVLPVVGTDDNGAKFRVEATNPNGTVTSDVITLTVTPDTSAPVPLAVTTLDGASLVVYFNELLDNKTLGNTAEEPYSYILTDPNDAANGVVNAAVLPDGKSVLLTITSPVGASYSLNVSVVEDRSGNAIPSEGVELAGVNYGLTAANVGALNPGGAESALDSSKFEVSGGGFDYQALAEQMRFAHKSVDGDFDARIRVHSITGTNRLESLAKAILNARATVDASGNSPSVSAFVTPAYPGNNSFGSSARATVGGPTSSNFLSVAHGLNSTPASYPNAWLRILRVGDSFTTFSSSNGTDWNQLGNITVAMGNPVFVGAGANSHRNGQYATATFSNFQVLAVVNSPALINSSYIAGTFSSSLQTQNGVVYRVQYKDDFNAANWSELTTITGDGTVKSYSDTAGANRYYRVIEGQ